MAPYVAPRPALCVAPKPGQRRGSKTACCLACIRPRYSLLVRAVPRGTAHTAPHVHISFCASSCTHTHHTPYVYNGHLVYPALCNSIAVTGVRRAPQTNDMSLACANCAATVVADRNKKLRRGLLPLLLSHF